MHRREPIYFDTLQLTFRSPLDGDAFHAVPLRADDERRYGLLLTSAAAPEIQPEVVWLAGCWRSRRRGC